MPQLGPANATTVAGTGEAGATIQVDTNGDGKADANTIVGADGAWSVALATPLANGTVVNVVAVDAAGNASSRATETVNTGTGTGTGNGPDTTPPAAPVVSGATDDVAPVQGALANGGATNDPTPTLRGTAEAGASIALFDGATQIGSAMADANGAWSFTPAAPLAVGAHSVTVIASDAAGNRSSASAPFVFTVDITAPGAPQVASTNGTSVSGTGEAGATILIDANGDGTSDATTTAGTNGSWSVSLGTPLANGSVVRVTAVDRAGNTSAAATATVTGAPGPGPGPDVTPPAQPVLATVTDNVAPEQGTLARGSVTNDTTPTFSGTAEANATITVFDGATQIGTTTADASGAWSITPVTPLAAGGHSVTMTARDAAGNTGPANAAFTFSVDTTAPRAPMVGPTDGITVSGTGEAGATIRIDTNGDGTAEQTTTVAGNGTWSVVLPTPLANGTQVSVTAVDAAGNTSVSATATVDTGADVTPPAAPVVSGATDDVTPEQGPIASGGATNDPTPTFTGTTEPGSTVAVFDNGNPIGAAVVDNGGGWSFTPTAPLGTGNHSLTFVATDGAGNPGAASAPFVVTIDTSAPTAPVFGGANDNANPVQGPIASGGTTNDTAPTFTGTAEPGSTVAVFDGAAQIGTAAVTAGGGWSFTPATPLGDGPHSVTFVATDAAGNESPATAAFDFSVLATGPAAPVVGGATDDVAPVVGAIVSGGITNDVRPTVNGTTVPGSTIIVFDGATPIGNATVDDTGAWTFTPATPLGNGEHSLTFVPTDPSGNDGSASTPFVITVDAAAPAAPVVSSAVDDVAGDQGPITNGEQTNDAQPTFSGTTEPGATVAVFGGATPLGSATVDAAGAWTFTPATPLGNGAHSVTFVATDAAGNVGPASAPVTFTVDVTNPAAPVVTAATDDVLPVQGPLANGGTTNDTRPGFSGRTEAGSSVAVFDGPTQIGTATVAANGTWAFTPATPLDDGAHSVTFVATDSAGNTGAASTPFAFTIDAVGPAAPTVGTVTVDVAPGTTPLASGGGTSDTTPTFTGTTEIGSTVAVFDGNTPIGAATVDAAGAWTFTPAAPLGEGAHSVTFVATDAAGAAGTPSAPFVLNVDTVIPSLSVAPSNGTVLTGTAEPGATVAIDLTGDLTPDNTAPVDGSGNWSYTPASPIADGATVTVTATDAAGNTSPAETVVIDASVPLAPVITDVTDNLPAGSAAVPNGGFSNDPTLTIAGTAEALATVRVFDGITLVGTTTADILGAWSVTTTALSAGAHSFTASSTDTTGNIGGPSPVYAVTTDYTAPLAPTLEPSDGVTLSGTAEAGANVQVDTTGDGTPDATALVGSNGQWAVTFAPPLADDTVIRVTAVDAAGNVSTPVTGTVDIAVDATPPAVPAITDATDDVAPEAGAIATGDTTNDTQPLLTGTAEPNVFVSIYDNDVFVTAFNSGATGNWTFTPATPLAQGAHIFTATTTDAIGNESLPSAALTFTVDSVAPLAPVINASNGQTVSGTTEAGSIVRLDLGGGATADVSSNATTGAWTYTATPALADGVTVRATAIDAAGNVSPEATVVVDAAAPALPVIAAVNDNVGTDTGDLTSGESTDDSRPTLSGTTEANATITVYNGGTPIGTASANEQGAWTFTPLAPLAQGARTLTVTATDTLGNVSASSAPFVLVVDNVAPATPAISSINDNVAPTIGDLAPGAVTDDTQPTLTGTADANVLVTVFRNGVQVGTTSADGDGDWTFTPATPLPQGSATFTVTAADAAGNVSGQSLPVQVTIDSDVPAAPLIASGVDNVGSVQNPLASGSVTDDAQPLLSGTAEPNATVTVLQNGTSIGTALTDALGAWSFTPAAAPDGTYTFTATVTSAAGVVGPASASFVLTIDTAGPTGTAIGGAEDDFGSVIAPLVDGSVTDDIIPVLSGVAAPGALVTIRDGNTVIGTAAANDSGAWTFTPTTALTEGAHAFTATATDAAGNTGPATDVFDLTVDTKAPATPTITPSTGTVLTGTAETGATVNINFNGDGNVDASTKAVDGGTWTYTPPAQLADVTTVIVSATDAAGNTSGTQSIIIDRTAPAAPIVTGAVDDVGTLTGTVGNGGTTDDVRPVLTGTAEPGALVTVLLDGATVGIVTATPGGTWSIPVATDLAPGQHVLTASAADALGNASPLSAPVTFTVDVATPAAPTIAAVTDNVDAGQGTVPNGTLTNDGIPTISGTAPANATIAVFDNGAPLGTVMADGTGAWSFTPTTPLGQGTHAFTAAATNAAGNAGSLSGAYSVVVDTVVPDTPAAPLVTDNVEALTGDIASGGVTNDTTPTLSGTTDPNATVSIFDGGVLLTTTVADGAGLWSVSPALAPGAHSITVSVTDAAGNVSATSPAATFTIDTAAPAAPTIDPTNGTGILTGTATPGTSVRIDIGDDGSFVV